jgi:hypothetical protein
MPQPRMGLQRQLFEEVPALPNIRLPIDVAGFAVTTEGAKATTPSAGAVDASGGQDDSRGGRR